MWDEKTGRIWAGPSADERRSCGRHRLILARVTPVRELRPEFTDNRCALHRRPSRRGRRSGNLSVLRVMT